MTNDRFYRPWNSRINELLFFSTSDYCKKLLIKFHPLSSFQCWSTLILKLPPLSIIRQRTKTWTLLWRFCWIELTSLPSSTIEIMNVFCTILTTHSPCKIGLCSLWGRNWIFYAPQFRLILALRWGLDSPSQNGETEYEQLVHVLSSADVARRLKHIAKRDKWRCVVKTWR